MKPLIFQVTTVGSPYNVLINEFKDRHLGYAEKWGFDFELIDNQDLSPWRKVEVLEDELQKRDLVIYLDADAVILDMQTDLRNAFLCRRSALGLAWHRCPHVYDHYNVGVVYAQQCRDAISVWKYFNGNELDQHMWREQHCLNKGLLDVLPNSVVKLDSKWHSTINLDYAPDIVAPVVVAAHGCGSWQNRLALLKQAVNRHDKERIQAA